MFNSRPWVEYRNPIGTSDSTLVPLVFGGGLIDYQDSTTGEHTHLLDFAPETSSWFDPPLVAGQRWVDTYTNLSISVDSATPAGWDVTVAYGPAPCIEAPTTVVVSPFNPSAYQGDTVTYAVTVINNDTVSCAPRNFTLSSSMQGTGRRPFHFRR